MTDLEQFVAMLRGAKINSYSSGEGLRDGCGQTNTVTVVRVNHGYRAHFEAEFDSEGKLLSMGQWEDM